MSPSEGYSVAHERYVLELDPAGASFEVSEPFGPPEPSTWRIAATLRPRVELSADAELLMGPVFDPTSATERDAFDHIFQLTWLDQTDAHPTLYDLVSKWWSHLRSLLDLSLARATAPFHPGVRAFVYKCVASDPTGRIAQLVHTCPGLLLLLAHPTAVDARPAALAQVVAGEPLARVIRETVAAVHSPASARWQAEARRLRVARAAPSLNCGVLLDTELLPIVPEDIPRDLRARESWFDWQWTVSDLGHVPEAVLHGFATFASCHFATLEELIRQRCRDLADREAALGQLIDYLRGTARVLTRRTSPARVLADCDAWHAREEWECDARPETPLPAEPWACHGRWRQGRDEIAPLRTVADLQAESRQMQHCVVTHTRPALAGDVAIFHAEILGSALTIEISAGSHNIPALTEASGIRNARPGPAQLAVIGDWLEDLRAIHDGRRPRRGRFIKEPPR